MGGRSGHFRMPDASSFEVWIATPLIFERPVGEPRSELARSRLTLWFRWRLWTFKERHPAVAGKPKSATAARWESELKSLCRARLHQMTRGARLPRAMLTRKPGAALRLSRPPCKPWMLTFPILSEPGYTLPTWPIGKTLPAPIRNYSERILPRAAWSKSKRWLTPICWSRSKPTRSRPFPLNKSPREKGHWNHRQSTCANCWKY